MINRVNGNTIQNRQKNGIVLDLMPELSIDTLKSFGEVAIKGSSEIRKENELTHAFVALGSQLKNKDCIVYVGSPGNYSLSLKRNKFEFTNCIFIIDECADLEWLKMVGTENLNIKTCSFVKIKNPIVSKDCVPAGFCSGNRMILIYLHYGLENLIGSLVDMDYCNTGTREPDSYNIELPSGIQSKWDYLAGYVYLKKLLTANDLEHLHESPMDFLSLEYLQSNFFLPKMDIPVFPKSRFVV